MSKLWERRTITLYFGPIVALIVVVIAALGAYEVWWYSQPTIPLDINTATVGHLTTLDGVDEPLAKQIIEGRPYHHKDELVQKNIIPRATYDKIKDQIVAKPK
jgi:helix-hairpin-helix protein